KINIADTNITTTIAGTDDYYILTDNHLIAINNELEVKNIPLKTLSNHRFSRLFYHQQKIFLLSDWKQSKEILILDNHLKSILKLHMPDNFLVLQCAYIDQEYWIQTFGGVYQFDSAGKIIAHIFPDKSISKMLKDKYNNYWFASNKTGIHIIPNFEDKTFLL